MSDPVVNAFALAVSVMSKLLLISMVGYFGSFYPVDRPLFTPPVMKAVANITMTVFLPSLYVTSLGSGLSLKYLPEFIVMGVFVIMNMVVSYINTYVVGLPLTKTKRNDKFFHMMAITSMFANTTSVPLLLISSSCDIPRVNAEYNSDPGLCTTMGISKLFIGQCFQAVGFFGFIMPIIEAEALLEESPDSFVVRYCVMLYHKLANFIGINSAEKTLSHSVNVIDVRESWYEWAVSVGRSALAIASQPSMIGMQIGIVVGLIPPLQRAMFDSPVSPLGTVGSALGTLGEPIVCISTLMMASALAQRKGPPSASAAEVVSSPAESPTLVAETELIILPLKPPLPSPPVAAVFDIVEPTVLTDISGADTELAGLASNNGYITNVTNHSLPSWTYIATSIICKLVLPPVIMLTALRVGISVGFLSKSQQMVQLCLIFLSCSPSLQILVIVLTQLGLTDEATKVSYVYLYQYGAAIVTITAWYTVALLTIY